MRRYGRVPVTTAEAASVVRAWREAWDRQAHRLPHDYLGIRASVTAATGTVLGAVNLVHVRPDLESVPLADPDLMWQDIADDYLSYVVDALVRWGDGDRSAPRRVEQYDPWLVRTKRRKPIASNG
jgi:hypothetical protein